jgi:hypothetical protein
MARKLLTLFVILALAGAVAAGSAAGSTTQYGGTVKGQDGSTVLLDFKTRKGKRTVRKWTAHDVRITCENGPVVFLKLAIKGPAAVTGRGKFTLKGARDGQKLRVKGRLSSRNNAGGTFRFFGPVSINGTTEQCDSGRLRWSVGATSI